METGKKKIRAVVSFQLQQICISLSYAGLTLGKRLRAVSLLRFSANSIGERRQFP